MLKKQMKLYGGDSAYPLCDVNRGRLWLDRTSTSNTRTCKNMQVLVVNLYVSKKRFISCIFPAMSIRCVAAGVAAGGSKTTKDGVRLQSGPVRRLFQRCVANTQSRRALNIATRLTSRTAPSRSGLLLNLLIKWKLILLNLS